MIREKESVLMGRLVNISGEIAEIEAMPAIERDVDHLFRLYAQRVGIRRDLKRIQANKNHLREAV